MPPRLEACSWGRWSPVPQPGSGSARSWVSQSRPAWWGCSRGPSWDLPLSTLALEGSSRLDGSRRTVFALGYADLVLLALALPVFLLAGWPLGGYAVAAGAWLAQRAIQSWASRRAIGAQKRGDRRTALGVMAAATLTRVWLITLAVLLVGLAEREAGLAAAVLSAALFTVYLATQFATRLLGP